jgi:hypothetical protein
MSTFLTAVNPTLAQAQTARFGGDSAGGGDAVKLEFTAVAQALLHMLPKLTAADSLRVSRQELGRIIQTTEIQTAEKVFLRGKEKDAVNEPNIPRITVSRTRWLALGSDLDRKMMFALHEYIGALHNNQVSDESYQVSGTLLRQMKGLLPGDFGKSHRFSCIVTETDQSGKSSVIAFEDDIRQWTPIDIRGSVSSDVGLILDVQFSATAIAANNRDPLAAVGLGSSSMVRVTFARFHTSEPDWSKAEVLFRYEPIVGDALLDTPTSSKVKVQGGKSTLRLLEANWSHGTIDLTCYKTVR